MKKSKVGLVMVMLCAQYGYAQSVADTLKTLNSKVSNLDILSGSVYVQTQTDAAGGQLLVSNASRRTTIHLRTDKSGGNLNLYTPSGRDGAYVGIDGAGGGEMALYSATSKSYSTYVGTYGLFIFDDSGAKQLATFTRNTDGTAGQVIINGSRVHDYSEVFDFAEKEGLKPGSVASASADGKGIKVSGRAYDPAVVGVISGAGSFQPGMQIGSREDGSSDLPVSVSGQVYVRVGLESGSIAVGDLLVSSSVAGVAMRGVDKTRMAGSVIGKALQPYSGQGEPLVRMMVMLR